MEWTDEARERFKEIPFFVRPAARKKIEKFAKERGETVISLEVYLTARQQFNKRS